jgi:hypothetical protein
MLSRLRLYVTGEQWYAAKLEAFCGFSVAGAEALDTILESRDNVDASRHHFLHERYQEPPTTVEALTDAKDRAENLLRETENLLRETEQQREALETELQQLKDFAAAQESWGTSEAPKHFADVLRDVGASVEPPTESDGT